MTEVLAALPALAPFWFARWKVGLCFVTQPGPLYTCALVKARLCVDCVEPGLPARPRDEDPWVDHPQPEEI